MDHRAEVPSSAVTRKRAWAAGLFAYGALVHLAALKFVASHYYRLAADAKQSRATFIHSPIANIGFSLLGGLFVAVFLIGLVGLADQRGASTHMRIVIAGGLRGILAATLALQTFFLVCAVVLGVSSMARAGDPHPVSLSFCALMLLSIEVYAFQFVIQAILFGFVYGIIASAWILISLRETRAQTSV